MTSSDFRRAARDKLRGKWLSASAICVISWLLTYFGTYFSESITLFKTVSALVSGDFGSFFSFVGLYSFSWVVAVATFFIGGAVMCGRAQFFLNASVNSSETSVENIFSHFSVAVKAFVAHVFISLARTLVFFVCVLPAGLFIMLARYIVSVRINGGTMSVFTGGIVLTAGLIGAALLFVLMIVPSLRLFFSLRMTAFIICEHPELSAFSAMSLSRKMMNGNVRRLVRLYLSFFGWFLLLPFTGFVLLLFVMPYVCMAETEFFNEISGNNYTRFLENQASMNRNYY